MTSEIKLHLGCGKRRLSGYIHIDLSDYSHIDYRCSVNKLDMINDGSVSIIYASHVLEYFSDKEAPSVLAEWYKKLKIGGILRLAVPDFGALVAVYQDTNRIELISGPILGIWQVSEWQQVQHKCLYDYRKLTQRLFKANFTAVRKWYWQEVFVGELAGFDDYSQAYIPHMDKEKGTLISLNLEAEK